MMDWFKKDTKPMTTGTEALRERIRVHFKKYNGANLARDLNIGQAALDAFAHTNGKLPDAVLDGIAKRFFGDNCSFDAERNLLKNNSPPPVLMPSPPARPLPINAGPIVRTGADLANPVAPGPMQPRLSRPGWAE
jgi:hypothetical protein